MQLYKLNESIMLIGDNTRLRTPRHFRREERDAIKEYLRNQVEQRHGEFGDKPFTAPDFVGFKNRDWTGTPLQVLYERYMEVYQGNHDVAYDRAGKAAGYLFKAALAESEFTYRIQRGSHWRKYKLVK